MPNIPITKKMANFKKNMNCDETMDIKYVGGIDKVYRQRLRTAGIYTVDQLKRGTRCMSQCEFESFLERKAGMNRQHAAMAYRCIHEFLQK